MNLLLWLPSRSVVEDLEVEWRSLFHLLTGRDYLARRTPAFWNQIRTARGSLLYRSVPSLPRRTAGPTRPYIAARRDYRSHRSAQGSQCGAYERKSWPHLAALPG